MVATAAAAIPFPQTASDLKPDPAATFGTLPNGLRYVIRANREPKTRASLRLLVEAGALHEHDDQQGLAHFLEHMAFNGSTHYAPGTLVKFFQRLGMDFGGDTNASTSFDRTLYLLELPDTKDETLAEGLRVFGDYAGGLLLTAAEIERERGVILSEKRSRDSVGYRTSLATRRFLLAGTRFIERDIIGTDDVLKQAQRDRFTAFYDGWYRPERMAVVIVGDIDPAAVERQIKATFAGLKPRAPAPAEPDLGQLPARTGVKAFYHYEVEAPSTRVGLSTIVPYRREPDTAANRLQHLPRALAHAIISRRLSILAKKENAPFTVGSAGAGEAENFYRQTSVSLNCKAEQWDAALAVGEQELRRATNASRTTGDSNQKVTDRSDAGANHERQNPRRSAQVNHVQQKTAIGFHVGHYRVNRRRRRHRVGRRRSGRIAHQKTAGELSNGQRCGCSRRLRRCLGFHYLLVLIAISVLIAATN